MSASAAALRSVLVNHTASEIETSGKVIEIDSNCAPLDAATILWTNNILGAPVWDEKQKKYLGFFDMRDTLSAIIASRKEIKDGNHLPMLTKWFEEMHVTVSYLAARNPFVSCLPETSLEQVCTLLSEHRCHRIPVMGKDGRCVSIISQSALVKALVKHVDDPLDETLEQANLHYKKDIVSAIDTASATDVFELLDSKRLSGIAVVDGETGKLVGNTSARDIKLAITTNVDMDMDILSYLATVRQATLTKKERYPFAHVATTSTVGHAIRLLEKTGYHRVFVVDENVKPVGVISVADVIRFAVE
jgi:CBS domain-containing protein